MEEWRGNRQGREKGPARLLTWSGSMPSASLIAGTAEIADRGRLKEERDASGRSIDGLRRRTVLLGQDDDRGKSPREKASRGTDGWMDRARQGVDGHDCGQAKNEDNSENKNTRKGG